MSNIIQVENLSKSYTISHENKERYTSLRDVIAQNVKRLFDFKRQSEISSKTKEEFWALKDVNFNIEKGDRVGIIGRNGAGKSTLLKVLSRITEPTSGSIKIKGRVASLLEVGTGFHPELTGRENIFLNGAILGMSRSEIKYHFDEIVDFAEIEKFLDTPVKRYSSGMYVRLAFAVAAHLEPEILVVDEVLAVGDAQFQKKCLGKMESVSKNEGRTVLFVSHNMRAIQDLCNKGILLEKGQLVADGGISKIIESYLNNNNLSSPVYYFNESKNIKASILSVTISDLENRPSPEIPFGMPWKVSIKIKIKEPVNDFIVALGMVSILGVPVRTVWQKPRKLEKGLYEAIFIENHIFFSSGIYKFVIGISERGQTIQYLDDNILFTVSNASFEGAKNIENVVDTSNGILLNSMETDIILLKE